MDPIDRIRELLGNVTNLSDQELTELRDLVLQQVGQIGDDTDDGDGSDDADGAATAGPPDDGTLALMSELAEATVTLNTEITRRNDTRATQRAFAAAQSGGVAELADTSGDAAPAGDGGEATGDGAADGDTDNGAGDASAEGTDGGADGDGDGADSEGGDGVTAGGEVRPLKGKIEPPAGRRAVVTARPKQVITASADVPGFQLGAEIGDPLVLGEAMCRRIDTLRNVRSRGADGEQVIVASIRLDEVPESRHLVKGDPDGNYRKVMEVVRPSAITAAGGMPAPVDVRYDLFGGGVTDRPVQAALPSFTADRGGIRFITPPTLAALSGAVGVWTVADDVSATDGSPTKPVLRVDAGDEVVVNTQAITVGLVFGNMTARVYPELVARHTDLSMVAHARVAEQQLLAQIGALSLNVKTPAQIVGAARHVLAQVDKALAGYRNRYRTGPLPIRQIFPAWFKDLLRADIALQLPGDGMETLILADSLINQWFSARGVNVTWALDGESGQDYGAQPDATSPGSPPVLTPGTLLDFKTTMIWYMFAEGTFLFLDGGTLDLGIVRDSTLNATNDYQTFVETFEAVAKVGYESMRVTTTVQPTGATSAAVAVTAGNV